MRKKMQDGTPISEKLTEDVIVEAVERQMFGTDNPGFCIKCGEEQDGCEPDAQQYECEACGTNTVYGASELLFDLGIGV